MHLTGRYSRHCAADSIPRLYLAYTLFAVVAQSRARYPNGFSPEASVNRISYQ